MSPTFADQLFVVLVFTKFVLGSSSGSSFDDFGCVHLSRLQLVVCGLHWTSVCA